MSSYSPSPMDTTNLSAVHEQLDNFERNFYLLNGLLGTLLNSAVLLVAALHVDTREKPRQLLVASMTVADLLTCTLYMLSRPYVNQFPRSFCYVYYISIVSPQLCSCLNLLWINVDKFLFIKRPLHYYSLVNQRRVLLVTALSWTLVLALVLLLYSFMQVKHPCDEVELSPRIYLLICVLYIVATSASFAISAVIFCIAHRFRRNQSREARSRLFKRLFFLFSSTLWTFGTCLPYRLLYLGMHLAPGHPSPLLYSVATTAYMVLVVGIVCNPLITIATQRLYRQWIFAYAGQLLFVVGLLRNRPEMPRERRKSELLKRSFLASRRREEEENDQKQREKKKSHNAELGAGKEEEEQQQSVLWGDGTTGGLARDELIS